MLNSTHSDISCVIVNYSTWKYTIKCIENLLEYNVGSIIVIENGSINDSFVKLKDYLEIKYTEDQFQILFENYNLIKSKKIYLVKVTNNGGFASGNNIALKLWFDYLNTNYIFLINNDVELRSDIFNEVKEVFKSSSKIKIVGCEIYNSKKSERMFIGKKRTRIFKYPKNINNKTSKNMSVDSVSGAGMFLSKNGFKEIGYMPEEYFLYGEEIDWNFNARDNGAEVVSCSAQIYHDANSTIKKEGYDFKYYYMFRNKYILQKKYQNRIIYIVFCVLLTTKLLIEYPKFKKRYNLKAVTVLYAIRDGLIGKSGRQVYDFL